MGIEYFKICDGDGRKVIKPSRKEFLETYKDGRCEDCANLTYDGPGCACWCKQHAPTWIPSKDYNVSSGLGYSSFGGYYKVD